MPAGGGKTAEGGGTKLAHPIQKKVQRIARIKVFSDKLEAIVN
jgi:hypothetical protein